MEKVGVCSSPQRAGGLGTGRERQRGGQESEPRTSPDATGPQPPIDGSALAPGAQMRPNSQKGPAGETLRSPGRLEPWGQQSAHQPGRWGQKWMPCPCGAWHHLPRVFGSLTLPWTTCHEGKQARWGCGRCPVTLKALSSCRQSPPPSRPCMLGARETSPTQALQRSRLVPVLLSYELHLTMSALGPSTQVEAGRWENTGHGCSFSKIYERLCCSSPRNTAVTPLAEGPCSRAREGNSSLCTIP